MTEGRQLDLAAKVRLVTGLIVVAALAWGLVHWWDYLSEIFSSREAFEGAISNQGEWAPIAFITFQALQVVFAPIPGELTGSAGGLLFGGLHGAIYATIGLAVGSSIAFLLGRAIGYPVLRLMASEAQIEKWSFTTARKQTVAVLAIFLIPGFPKDIVTYLFALSEIRFWTFFWASQIGRIPGTLLLTFGSSALLKGNWYVVAAVVAITALMLGVGYWKRRAIQEWLAQDPDHPTSSPNTLGNSRTNQKTRS